MLARVVVAEPDRLAVGLNKVRLARVGLGEQRLIDIDVDVEQPREYTHVGDILHEHARTRAFEVGVAEL